MPSLEALAHSKRERLSVLCLAGGYVVGTYAGQGRLRPTYAAGAHLAWAWISFLYAKGNMRWARELRLVQRPSRIAIGYHHCNGNGRGHRAMAERLQSRLQSAGFPTDLVDRSQGALNEAVNKRATYFAKLHVGRNAAFVRMLEGTESIPIPGRFEFDWTPDMGPLDLMPFSRDTLQRADPVSARAALAEVGVETRGRQIVTVSGGGAGTGMEWRLPLVAKALEDLDVLIVGLIGDSCDHPYRRAAIETAVEGFEHVAIVGHLDREQFNSILSGADVNVGYPGSSSVSDLLSYTNQNVILSKLRGSLASSNMEWAQRHYGVKGYYRADFETLRSDLHTALSRSLDRQMEARRYVHNTREYNKRFLESVEGVCLAAPRVRAARVRKLHRNAVLCAVGATAFAYAAGRALRG